ncbi:cytochrome c3 family protein [uncultured Desulfuromusa sp.]|uniref:cytochrome c3 family protein n=1 Tax=uncultured Desulfuromusa sp. TaxID=219183 RepID=UPI002AA74B4D|nr:cytochrome c3 family protein [uncultured Desulfuromusa sp.]
MSTISQGYSMLARATLIIVFLFIIQLSSAPDVLSQFHSGGVGSCNGCHISHSSSASVSPLLLATDPSSLCLNCHSGPGSSDAASVFSFDGSALTPGGDFYWTTKTFTWAGGSSPAARHGHNVIARDFALDVDPNKLQGPGGSYPASQLSCISCHDPHGKSGGGTRAGAPAVSVSGSYGDQPMPGTSSGNYRLLGGVGYSVNGYTFNYPAPVARQNPAQPFGESDVSHVDYGSGMSEWCANCHGAVLTNEHQFGSQSFKHPVNNNLGGEIVSNYNNYVKTGDLNGTTATAFLQFVPFARGTTTTEVLDPTSSNGPDSNSEINCLSCHRAHASAFRVAGRWDFNAPLLIDSHPAVGDTGATAGDVSHSYYNRNMGEEFGSGQGQFCEKCHATNTP